MTVPNPSLVGFEVSWPGVTPVPDRGMVSVGFGAFEVMVIFPVALPAACGANTTLKFVL